MLFASCRKSNSKISLEEDHFLDKYANLYILPDSQHKVPYEPIVFEEYSTIEQRATINDSISSYKYYSRKWDFRKTESFFYWNLSFCDVPNVRHELYRSNKMNQIKKVNNKYLLFNLSDGDFRRYEFTRNYFLIHTKDQIQYFIKSSKIFFDEETLISSFTTFENLRIETQMILKPNIYQIRIFRQNKLIIQDFIAHYSELKNLPSQ